jgi:hypothetical protein
LPLCTIGTITKPKRRGRSRRGASTLMRSSVASRRRLSACVRSAEEELTAQATMQYWQAFGVGSGAPELTLGRLVLEALARRHPLVFGPEPAGAA